MELARWVRVLIGELHGVMIEVPARFEARRADPRAAAPSRRGAAADVASGALVRSRSVPRRKADAPGDRVGYA